MKIGSSSNEVNGMDVYEFGRVGVSETLSKSEVSLRLDSYEDLFSDFDPRSYAQRALSQDFLEELKRATQEVKDKSFRLRLLVPAALRKMQDESVIRKRLKDHFKKHALCLEKEHKKLVRKGAILTVVGFLLMGGATFLYGYQDNNLFYSFLIILFEPAGWFAVWYGLDLIFYLGKERKSEFEFYEKMSTAEVKLDSY